MVLFSVEIITLLLLVMQYLILQHAAAIFLPPGETVWSSVHQECGAPALVVEVLLSAVSLKEL